MPPTSLVVIGTDVTLNTDTRDLNARKPPAHVQRDARSTKPQSSQGSSEWSIEDGIIFGFSGLGCRGQALESWKGLY